MLALVVLEETLHLARVGLGLLLAGRATHVGAGEQLLHDVRVVDLAAPAQALLLRVQLLVLFDLQGQRKDPSDEHIFNTIHIAKVFALAKALFVFIFFLVKMRSTTIIGDVRFPS